MFFCQSFTATTYKKRFHGTLTYPSNGSQTPKTRIAKMESPRIVVFFCHEKEGISHGGEQGACTL